MSGTKTWFALHIKESKASKRFIQSATGPSFGTQAETLKERADLRGTSKVYGDYRYKGARRTGSNRREGRRVSEERAGAR